MRYTTQLEINLELLRHNVLKIKNKAPGMSLIPMVKADAYGHGVVPISNFLIQETEINQLGVASIGEAQQILENVRQKNYQIIIFSDTEIGNASFQHLYRERPLIPVIHKISDLQIFLNDENFKSLPLYLKINTGMNRLGLTVDEIEPFLPILKKRGRIDHLMTHFACSYMLLKDGDKTHRQYEDFLKVKNYFLQNSISILETSVSNSGAIEQNFGFLESHLRPGLMLYGPYSVDHEKWNGFQISRLTTKVLKTFSVKKGTPVGYGVHVAGEDLFIIILPIGYGDGLLTFMSGIEIKINGHTGKVFGRVNMDMMFIAFHPSVAGKIKENDIVEIWGHDNKTLSTLAQQMKTHSYQVMTALSPRIPKIYKVK